jgi:putative FmdB family regulatory protein
MPVYEFRCETCRSQFEARQSLGERAAGRPPCPSCGSDKVEPILSSFFARTSRKA